ncbi:MAG: glycosyltransferase family 2 protein [Anaerolineae bacterium]|jgi:(heptosyl)LPS beta-1,4-glucosyltransferase|nr:glycosyltransferase family 2 protein [Chloroflexota bacterium]
MASLTAAVLASNNEEIIARCLQSVAWADELLVILDTRSTDRTAEISEGLGARVHRSRFENFAQQRNVGFAETRTEWLFYIDSDEEATPALAQEILHVVAHGQETGWWVPRRNFLWGKETRHGGWYPDYQMRLYRVDCARYDVDYPVHEMVQLQGEAGHLQQPLIHHNYASLGQFITKQHQYVELEAQRRFQAGIRPHVWTRFSQPLREFWRHYVRLQGFRDGWHGLKLCALVAYYYGYAVTARLSQLWRAHEAAG